MLEIKVTVEIPGLMELARAIAGVTAGQAAQPVQAQSALVTQQPPTQQFAQAPVQSVPVAQQPAPQQYNQVPVQSAPVTPQSAPQQYNQAPVQSAPVQQPQAQQQASVPTTHATQQYTQDQVAIAMTQLMDAGKIDVVTGIMQQFGVQTLMQIPKDRYPELAVILRQAGAQI